jgi:hypothetical protein
MAKDAALDRVADEDLHASLIGCQRIHLPGGLVRPRMTAAPARVILA